MEARFVGIRRCLHCHSTVVMLLPRGAELNASGERTALGVRVEPAIAAFLDETRGGGEAPSLVECLLDAWRERGWVPIRVMIDEETPGVLVGTVCLRQPSDLATARCTPGEAVLIAVELGLSFEIDDDLLTGESNVCHGVAGRGRASTLL